MAGQRTRNILIALPIAVICAAVAHRNLPVRDLTPVRTTVELTTAAGGNYDLFLDEGDGFRGDRSIRTELKGSPDRQLVEFTWPADQRNVKALRFDPGDAITDVSIHSFRIDGPGGSVTWNAADVLHRFGRLHGLETLPESDDRLILYIRRDDPWIATSADISSSVSEVAHGRSPFRHWSVVVFIGLCTFFASLGSLLALRRWRRRSPPGNVKATVLTLAVDVVVAVALFGICQRTGAKVSGVELQLQVLAFADDTYQVFYSQLSGQFGPERCVASTVKSSTKPQWLRFAFPQDTLPHAIRIDPGSRADSLVIFSAAFAHGDERETIGANELLNAFDNKHDIATAQLRNGGVTLRFSGHDPYVSLADLFHDRMTAVVERDRPFWLPLLASAIITLLVHTGFMRSTRYVAVVGSARPEDLRLAGAFMLLIFIPLLTVLAPRLVPPRDFGEKRRLAELPSPELRSLGQFSSRYDKWYRDHFGFREELFRWNSWMHIRVLRTSPLPDRVIMGKDGWFFQYNKEVDGDYRGRTLYTFTELEHIRHIYEERQRWLASFGIRYYVLVPPLSGNMHREHMPDRFHRISDSTWLDQVKSHFDTYSTVELIDVRNDLKAAKNERDVYFKTDIHWNPYGSYFGYRQLMRRVHRDVPAVGPPCTLEDLAFRVDTNDHGDLAGMLGLNDVLTRVEPFIVPLRPHKATFSHFPELPGQYYFLDRPMTYSQPDTTLPKLLMFHDSFGLYLKPLISEHFSRSTFVWSGLFLPDVVIAEKPDVVVQEFMEMFMVNMPKDTIPLSW